MKLILAGALALTSMEANALLVQTQKGTYMVEPSAGGFEVYGLSGQGVTSVIRHGDSGYSVIGPNGVSNIYMDNPGEVKGFSVDPSNVDVTPLPGFGDR